MTAPITIRVDSRTFHRGDYEHRERTRPSDCGSEGCCTGFGCSHDMGCAVREYTCDWCGGVGRTEQGTGNYWRPVEHVECFICHGVGFVVKRAATKGRDAKRAVATVGAQRKKRTR